MSTSYAWLSGSRAARILVTGAVVKIATVAVAALWPASTLLRYVDLAANVCLVAGALLLGYRLFEAARARLLWRVRRKLTLSYMFIGVVPALLIVTFFLLCGLLVIFNVSSYLIQSRIRALVAQTDFLARTAALELRRVSDAELSDTLTHRQTAAVGRYPFASYALVPLERPCDERPVSDLPPLKPLAVGPWAHLDPPVSLPTWVSCSGESSLVAYMERTGEQRANRTRLAIRAVAIPDVLVPRFAVIVDVPVSPELVEELRTETGVSLGALTILSNRSEQPTLIGSPLPPAIATPGPGNDSTPLMRRPLEWVAFLNYRDWDTGQSGSLTAAIQTTVAGVYERVAGAQVTPLPEFSFGQLLLALLGAVAGLFLVIQVVALGMGLALARSITGSVHELFVGTARVREGDFTHKIPIQTRDQLGELAESFNSMTTSIEDLLRQKAEKERLEQELRFARAIQMSLLPQAGLRLPGLAISGHCEPAREVGGDYYDFLPIDDRRVGILVADVSGKGASAALYMAQLKGVMLSLSEIHVSPRALLIAANRILSRHLDSRSFITMTYAVVDLGSRTMTYARAGHCPLIYVPGPYSSSREAQVLAPDGLVVGLQIDDAPALFARLLEERTMPLGPGDFILLFTDGLTEAMNPAGDCFGETRLAALVEQHTELSPEELRERIIREVSAFVGATAQQDDMTMLVLKMDSVLAGLTPAATAATAASGH